MKNDTAESMWESLEKQARVPTAKTIKYLSGLLDEDIARFKALWPDLALETRRALVTTLSEAAESDFEMDFSAIFSFALGDPDSEIRGIAIEGLHEVEDVRLIPHYARILQEDEVASTRAKAAQALAQFVLLGELGKIRPRSFDLARSVLLAAYGNPDEDMEVLRRSLESLAYTALDGIPDLISVAYAHPDEKMRISAVFAMGRSADARWAEPVVQELSSVLPEMRYEAARACGELSLRQAVPALIDLVNSDVDIEVQQIALWSLGQIGGQQAQKILARYVNAENEALQDAAREALEELEFFHGDLSSFFGPPTEFDGESELGWDDELDEFDDPDDFDEEDEDVWFA